MKTQKIILLFLALLLQSTFIFSQCVDETNIYTFDFNGHTYEIVKENKNWVEAINCAVERGGFLTEIETEEEGNTIFEEITNNAGININNTENQFGTSAVWIGGNDNETEGVWIWDGDNDGVGTQFWQGGTNGNPVGGAYTNWGVNPPEPDNNTGFQNKLTLTIDTFVPNFGLWNDLKDLANLNTIYFIIEYNTILSVGENSLKTLLITYPNPFTNFITISNKTGLVIQKIKVIDNLGKVISTIKKEEISNDKVDVSNLSNGIYFLNIYFENDTSVMKKMVK